MKSPALRPALAAPTSEPVERGCAGPVPGSASPEPRSGRARAAAGRTARSWSWMALARYLGGWRAVFEPFSQTGGESRADGARRRSALPDSSSRLPSLSRNGVRRDARSPSVCGRPDNHAGHVATWPVKKRQAPRHDQAHVARVQPRRLRLAGQLLSVLFQPLAGARPRLALTAEPACDDEVCRRWGMRGRTLSDGEMRRRGQHGAVAWQGFRDIQRRWRPHRAGTSRRCVVDRSRTRRPSSQWSAGIVWGRVQRQSPRS